MKPRPALVPCIVGTLLVVAACQTKRDSRVDSSASSASTVSDSTTGYHRGLLYGRVTLNDGATYEGRLRFGGDEEALWGNFFNGTKRGNPWADLVPSEQLPSESETIKVLGVRLGTINHDADVGRPFMARFGDIVRIETRDRDLDVTLKSGSVVRLNRFGADDFADGVRVWDERGVMNLVEWGIRNIEFFAGPDSGAAPLPLYGSVRTAQGVFTGLIQWNRKECLASDILYGATAEGRGLRFAEIKSISRQSQRMATVTLRDGREVAISGVSKDAASPVDRGIYVDDPRYGRVLISWDAFERVDFSEGGTGPAYSDFSVGHQLIGSVTTRSGRRVIGRLVYDLDESESNETLDAQTNGVNYSIPFGMIASIALPAAEGAQRVRVSLHGGEELLLERDGDLADRNGGMLVFVTGSERPEYLRWIDVAKVEFEKSIR